MRRAFWTLVVGAAMLVLPAAEAKDVRITIPQGSDATPVQKLNQQGVKELQKHHLEKAQKIFYKAYLLDPDDPFDGTICDGSNCSSVSTFSGSYTFDSAASDVPARYPRAQLCDHLIR